MAYKEHISCIQFNLFSFKERQELVKVFVDQQFFSLMLLEFYLTHAFSFGLFNRNFMIKQSKKFEELQQCGTFCLFQ